MNGLSLLLIRVVLALVVLAACSAPAVAQEVVEYIHTDALGSPVAITDANGQVIERTVYEPYGAVVNRPLTDGPGYTGHVTDSETGLSYMQQRYYDPALGAFLSTDPISATEHLFSRYNYASSHPYRYTDPDGRAAQDELKATAPIKDLAPVKVTAQGASSAGSGRPAAQPSSAASVVTLGTVFVRAAPVAVPAVSSGVAATVAAPLLFFVAPHPCGGRRCGELTEESRRHPNGYWPGDRGAEEWGRRNDVGSNEGRRRFHGIKQADKGQGGGKGLDDYGTNPDTGDVVNPQGEVVGNLGDR